MYNPSYDNHTFCYTLPEMGNKNEWNVNLYVIRYDSRNFDGHNFGHNTTWEYVWVNSICNHNWDISWLCCWNSYWFASYYCWHTVWIIGSKYGMHVMRYGR